MDNKNKKFVAAELPISSVCNLDCKYCYIPKNDILKKINKKWMPKINNGEYNLILEDFYPTEDLQAISLWGAEPSLGFDAFRIRETFDQFENLDTISTSTNFAVFNPLKHLLSDISEVAENKNKEIKLSLQVSLDGNKEMTDKNRGEGTYQKISKNLEKLYNFSTEVSDKVEVIILFKSTNSAEDIKIFADSEKILYEYCQNFLNLGKKFDNWPKNFKFQYHTLPSLALPGDYTTEDGKNFYKYHSNLNKVLNKINKEEREANTGFYYPSEDIYYIRLVNMLKNVDHLRFSSARHLFNCAAGRSMAAVDPDGTFHGCHGSFWYNYTDYIDTIDENNAEWKEGKRILDYNSKKFADNTKDITAQFRDDLNQSRLKYILELHASEFEHKMNVAYMTIRMLAISGQVSEVYKKENWAKIFAHWISLNNNCWLNNKYSNGTFFAHDLSVYRMYGNGLLESYIRRLYKELGISETTGSIL